MLDGFSFPDHGNVLRATNLNYFISNSKQEHIKGITPEVGIGDLKLSI
jgi:hypothetical protein